MLRVNVEKENAEENKKNQMAKKIGIFIFFLILNVFVVKGQKDQNESIFVVDTNASSISWICGSHYGCINIDTGTIFVNINKVIGGDFKIDMGSLYDEDIEQELLRLTLANVIKSHEFFDAPHYPTADFAIEKLIKIRDNEYNVAGNLTLKGKTLPINFNSEIVWKGDTITVNTGYFGIDRTRWGIIYLSKRFDPEDKEQMHVPDEIKILIQLKAIKYKK